MMSKASKPTRKRRATAKKRRTTRKKVERTSPRESFLTTGPVIEVREERTLARADLDIDHGLWGRAKTQWLLGDWESLASLDLTHLEHDPQRAELAALSACAHLQKGDKQSARKSLAAASRWKCSPAFMVRALIASSEACMAHYHRISGREEKATALLASSAGAFGGDSTLAARTRLALDAAGKTQRGTSNDPPPQNESEPSSVTGAASLTLDEAIAVAKQEESPWAKPGITSYAQNFEDVMLWRALGHIENGFYIDIGAHDPVVHSVGKAFYDAGWSGVEVEPQPDFAKQLRRMRPRNTVIQACVSSNPKDLTFFKLGGLSTPSEAVANHHRSKGHSLTEAIVPAVALHDVLSAAGHQTIHWLKIDAEGWELPILQGWSAHPARPWIVVVECTLPDTQVSTHASWDNLLLSRDYQFVYFDGLNRFYLHSAHSELALCFTRPPNIFDNFTASH